MKKKLTLVLALCACFAFSAAFTACETEETNSSSSPAVNSSLESAPETPVTPVTPTETQVTETQWAAAFGFDNVTMEYYLVSGETARLYQTFYLDGNKALVGEDGEMFEMTSSYLTWLREIADFSGLYADFTYDSEKKAYFVASKDVLGDGSLFMKTCILPLLTGKWLPARQP